MSSMTQSTQCSGSIALIHDVTASNRPKFDTPARRCDHGTPSSFGGGDEGAERLHYQMEAADPSDVVPLRGDPYQVLSPGRAGEPGQERAVREAQVPGGRLAGPSHVPASTSTRASSQPVHLMDSVCQVRGPADLRVQAEPSAQSKSRVKAAPPTPPSDLNPDQIPLGPGQAGTSCRTRFTPS